MPHTCRFMAASILMATAALPAAPPASAPAAPKGYASTAEVFAAIQSGEVKLIGMNPPLPEDVVLTSGIEYGKAGDTSLKLDLYQPKNLSRPVPAIILIHGGAWRGGHRNHYRYYGIKFAQQGYVAASISYRLINVAPFPAAVEDAKCAVRFIRANAGKYHVDPDKIAAMGGSAGGHLAMMVGYSADVAELEGSGGNGKVSSRVQAVINYYGPTDLTTPFARDNRLVIDFLGGKSYAEHQELYKLASPLTHLTKDDPPTLTLHGTIDDVVPIEQADRLKKRLTELGLPHEYVRLDGWPHTLDLAVEVNRYCRSHIDRFLAKHLPLPTIRPATKPTR